MSAAHIISLKGRNSFEKVFRQSRKFSLSNIAMHMQFGSTRADVTRSLQVGIAVRKKLVPRAVDRNRIKRLIRASLTQLEQQRPDVFEGIDAMIVSWNTRRSPKSSSPRQHEVLSLMDTIFTQSRASKHRRLS